MQISLFFAIILQVMAPLKGSPTALGKQEQTMLSQLKVVLMHFIEPLLVDANIKNYNMEGHNTQSVLEHLIPLISGVTDKAKCSDERILLQNFQKKLSGGFDLFRDHLALSSTAVTYPAEDRVSKKIKSLSKVIQVLEEKESIYIPFSYSLIPMGHAMSMVIKGNSHGRVDITVINTGQGSEYSKFVKDPAGLSVMMRVPWIEFVDVPKRLLTDNENWFAHGIIAMKDPSFMKQIEMRDEEIGHYIYGSFLGNLAEYFKPTDLATEQRQMMLQLSGSCVYSALMGTLLYFSSSQQEFETVRARIGLQLFDEFWMTYSKSDVFTGIMTDANEYQARALLANLASGLARQAAELWRAYDPNAFKGLIMTTNAAKKNENDCPAGKLDMSLIKDLVDRAMKVLEFYKAIKINEDSSKFMMNASLASLLNPSSLSKFSEPVAPQIDGKDLYKGTDFASEAEAISAIAKPVDSTLPIIISSLRELTEALETALKPAKSYTGCPNFYLQNLLLDKVYPIFKLADKGNGAWYKWIEESNDKYQLKEAMSVAYEIGNQLFQFSHGRMYLEEFVALQQLLLLTWKAAQRYDKITGNYFEMNSYSAPVSSRTMFFKPYEQYYSDLQDNTYLDPKLQFESMLGYIDVETLAQLKRTDDELEKGDERFMPIDKLLNSGLALTSATQFADFIQQSGDIKGIRKILDLLKKKYFDKAGFESYKFDYSQFYFAGIMEEIMAMANIGDQGQSQLNSIPEFYYPFFMSIYFANMQYSRPVGHLKQSFTPFGVLIHGDFQGITFNIEKPAKCFSGKKFEAKLNGLLTLHDLSVFSIFFDDNQELEQNDKLRYFGAFRTAELRTKLTSSENNTDFQALSSTKIDSILEWLENSQSAAVFRSYDVYHAIDRLLANPVVLQDTKHYQHKRLVEALYAIVDKDVTSFLKKYSTSSLEQKQTLLHRGLQAAFVLARYMQNLLALEVNTVNLAPVILDYYAKLYQLYVPFLKINSVYLMENSDLASVHALLFIMNSFSNAHLKDFVKKITYEFTDNWLTEKNQATAMDALAYYHKFVYELGIERRDTRNRFTDVYDFSKQSLPTFRMSIATSSLPLSNSLFSR